MMYPHQEKALRYLAEKLQKDPQVEALLLSGSIAHGFHTAQSDVDINIVVTKELYEQKKADIALTYWETASEFYPEGYFDGKFITADTLRLVAEKGNEPTRFALHDAVVVFDKTGRVQELLDRIKAYPEEAVPENTLRFLSQLMAWKWYCGEALQKGNQYLLDVSVTRMILFGGRLILLDNRMFFPYHKWFLRVLEEAPQKPEGLPACIQALLREKSAENIQAFFDMILAHKDWAQGKSFNWPAYFARDVELKWMTDEEFIENI